MAYLLLPSQSQNKLVWVVPMIKCDRRGKFFDWPKRPEKLTKNDVKPFQSVVSSGLGRTTLEKFENTALFLQLGLPSTLISHDNEAFRKDFSNCTGGI